MNLFKRKDPEEEEYEEDFSAPKDLKPQNKKKRKEPIKPWGKQERYIVLAILLASVLISLILSASARNFKLPGLPKVSFGKISLPNLFSEEIIEIGGGNNSTKDEEIKRSFEERTLPLSGVYALYVIDLTTGNNFGVNENEVMQAASLIKLPVMSLVYEKGLEKDYEDELQAMGKRSDNNAFNKVVSVMGEEKIEEYIKTLGMKNTSLMENTTTPKEIGEFFKKFRNAPFMEFLVDTIYEEHLAKGIPEGVKVIHKYGREVHVVNDAGVVISEHPYIVVIMGDGVVESEADLVFPELSSLVYDGMNK